MAQDTYTNAGLTPKKVSFASGSEHVVAHLYLPEDYSPSKRYPALVLGGPLSTVKEQVSGNYASQMARRGFIALAVDFRNYGESGGAKRQHEDPESKSQDLSAALEFLAARSDVSGTGLLGICTTGGNVLYTAARDLLAMAVATVVGAFFEPSLSLSLLGPELSRQRLSEAAAARELYDTTGEIECIRAYHDSDKAALNISEYFDYYRNQGRGGGVSAWRNAFAVMSHEAWQAFDPVSRAASVTAPTLVIHSEYAAFPDQARKAHSLLGGKKELKFLQGTHFDFYDQADKVGEVADLLAEHFNRTLQLSAQ
jgi:fermentation-respiration switch protein FrsA (DUF1100 family)